MTGQSGIVEFKSQKDIIADRRKQTEQQLQELQKRVGRIIQSNYHLAQSAKTK
jgi:prefoldin subunit 5